MYDLIKSKLFLGRFGIHIKSHSGGCEIGVFTIEKSDLTYSSIKSTHNLFN